MNKMSNDFVIAKDKLIKAFKDYHWFHCVSYKESNNDYILNLEVASFNDLTDNGIRDTILQRIPELEVDGFKFEIVMIPRKLIPLGKND